MSDPTWTILIPTLGQRRALFARLLDHLMPQVEPYAGRFRVVALWNNGEWPIGVIRQKLLDGVGTDYVSFVDDDDLVADFYVAEVARAIQRGPEYVGWMVQCYANGEPWKMGYCSLEHGAWRNDVDLYRDITHTNVLRTDVARLGRFDVARSGEAEDYSWVKQLRGKVTDQVYVPRVMYHYYHDPSSSTWTQRYRNINAGPHRKLEVRHPHFSYHPESRP